MTGLFWNLLLATCWVFFTGSFAPLNYLFGFFIGYLVITLIRHLSPSLKSYPSKIPRFFSFVGYFIRELILSNIEVAIDIVTPLWRMKPGVIRFKTSGLNDLEITALANLISLTPGTLVLDVSEDKSTLFVHAMFLHDEQGVQHNLRQLEQRLLQVIR